MWQGGSETQDIAAHYELICADWRAGKEVYLAARFDKHGQAGLDFLLAQLSGGGMRKSGCLPLPWQLRYCPN